MTTQNDVTWYAPLLAKWLPAEMGPKPTADQLKAAHAFKRPGVEALHIAMCMRAGGCTVRQFLIAGSCGPANNTRRDLVQRGLFTQTVTGKPYAYTLKLTATGNAAVKAAATGKAVTATAKPKGTVKAAPAAKAKAKAAKPASKPAKPAVAAPVKPVKPVAVQPVTPPVAAPVTVAVQPSSAT